MNKEQRSITSEIRLSNDSRLVEGYALLFNTESRDLGGFTEIIEPNSLDGVIERSDVFCVLNHQNERGILARSKKGSGSLILEVDETGLKYLFEAPNTALGDELLEYLKRGDITGSSFAFIVNEDKWENNNGKYLRRIKSFDLLFDVSPVFNPAYEETSVAKRSLDNILEEQRQAEEAKKVAEDKAKKEELNKYFENLRNSIKSIQ